MLYFQEGMMLVTVTGLFKEYYNRNKEISRYFNRTFIIVPEGAGFCICNEQLHVSNPTIDQEKQFKKCSIDSYPTPGSSTLSETITNQSSISEEVKQQMTITLSQQTNMNFEWSLKCLKEVQWNFDSAHAAFQKAYSLGQIPSHAFIH